MVNVDEQKVRDLADLLGRTGDIDRLPPLWHWVATVHWAPVGTLRPDGHPFAVADGVPPEFSRRMFAGGEVVLHSEVAVGSELERVMVSSTAEHKDGRSGPFVLSRVELEYRSRGEMAFTERQDIVYRPAASVEPSSAQLPERRAAGSVLTAPEPDGSWQFQTDPVALMRFSALTANSHRIHYDWPYATAIEGYPDLVVHGPLMTLSSLDAFQRGTARRITRVRHRNVSPLFCGETAAITIQDSDGTSAVTLSAHRGGEPVPCVAVEVDWAPA